MDKDFEYLNQLNPQQRDAVEYVDGPSLVIAGAGSGKTRVLTYKIVHLLNLGYKPYRILALTFTNKAAREMKERIAKLVSPEEASALWMGTFHSVFAKILRINAERIGYNSNYTIYDTSDSKSLIKQIVKDLELDDKVYKIANVQSHISNLKNSLISPQDYASDHEMREADKRAKRPRMHEIYSMYWNRCRLADAMDFDDLLFNTNILLRDCPDVLDKYQNFFDYVLVDEYQDTNFAQHLIVSKLTAKSQKLCVVGDDAQSIYSFRGANISNILNLNKAYPTLKTFKLERNYRSTQNIINAANSLIEQNRRQIPKHIFSENNIGEKIQVIRAFSDFEESYIIANQIVGLKARSGDHYNDFAVLYRTNAQSRPLEEALRKRDIPYRIYGGLSFYQRKEIKDAVCYFRLTVNPVDEEALRRVINFPARGIGDTTIKKVQVCATQNNVSMWAVVSDPDKYELPVNAGTKKKLLSFSSLIKSFVELNENGADAYVLASRILMDSGIMELVSSDNTPENISRRENLDELLSGVNEYVAMHSEEGDDNVRLYNFLSEISLATDQDSDDSAEGNCVTLMTVHAAKGLEFRHVLIVGMEEDLFPSAMSLDSMEGLEEERRLFYVAITRAMQTCHVTYAQSRFRNGEIVSSRLSRFLRDINPSYLQFAQRAGTPAATERNSYYPKPEPARPSVATARPAVPSPNFRPVKSAVPAPASSF
ncbi:MAG: UvrD-helicase domain-containing protein, partial [Bacteroidaceae bacterium]|nr:UvrD-helicase domain-containing protein [Bacteroidaceae bacterium]